MRGSRRWRGWSPRRESRLASIDLEVDFMTRRAASTAAAWSADAETPNVPSPPSRACHVLAL
jgi:hypothetical protein